MGPVQAGQRVEDRSLGGIVGRKAQVDVLVDLDVRNVRPSRKVATIPAFRPKRLPLLTDIRAQWIVNEEEIRIAVLIAGHGLGQLGSVRGPRIVGDDPDEEVRREERTEDHHLGDDEKQHPQRRCRHARGAVRRRWPVVLVVVRDRRGFHLYAFAAAVSPWTMWSTGLPVALRTRSMRSARNQPDLVSGNVEITMSSTRKY